MPDPRQQDIEKFLKKWFSTPDALPDEFKSWLLSFIQQNPNLSLPLGALPGLAGRKTALGNPALTFDGAAVNSVAQQTITHGLGVIPVAVLACVGQGGQSLGIWVATDTYTATTFRLTAIFNVGARTDTINFPWLAIGR